MIGSIRMVKIALCDDNSVFLNNMAKLVEAELAKYTVDFCVEKYVSGKVLFNHHLCDPYNIIFLDIDMPQMNGFDVAAEFRKQSNQCYIIFVTSHSDLVYDSMDFQPFNFIPKGNTELFVKKLKSVVKQLMTHVKQNRKIVLEDNELGRMGICLKDILYIESNKHYVIYHIDKMKNTVQVRANIGDLEKEYEKYDFARVHKKYLVNLKHIFNLDMNNDVVIFKQNFELPMSRNMKASVNEKLMKYLRLMG